MIRHEYIYDNTFEFEGGGGIDHLKLVYHTSEGTPAGRAVVWICHALTANSNAEDWWPELVGPGRLFDTEKYFVVCVNMIGSAYGSSGPAAKRPDGGPYYFDFPRVSVRDIVRGNILARKYLGIDRIDILTGGSIGSFQALEWAIMEPKIIRHLVFIASNARVTPWMTAFNESQRMALEADPTFRTCGSLRGGEEGLKCARSIALISYRSYDGYNLTQAESSEDALFADRAASYQRYQGKKLADRFDAYSYYYMTWSVDSHNVGRGRGGVEAALATIKARTTVVGINSDVLFPVREQRYVAEHIPGAEFYEIASRFGHDGFLLEYPQLTAILGPIMKEIDLNSELNKED